MADKFVVLTVKIPKQLYKELDELVKGGRYASKSEIIREALREFIEKHGRRGE